MFEGATGGGGGVGLGGGFVIIGGINDRIVLMIASGGAVDNGGIFDVTPGPLVAIGVLGIAIFVVVINCELAVVGYWLVWIGGGLNSWPPYAVVCTVEVICMLGVVDVL